MRRETGPPGPSLQAAAACGQGRRRLPGSDGAPPGFDIKQGGLGSAAQALALATLCGVLFLTFLDNTVVSVGLANVQSDLHAGVTSLQWVVNGYALTFASFMLVAGMLGDIFGRKRIMLIGVAVFCGGSVVAALAGNVDWLIAGRVIMGIGAAASEPGTFSIIRHVYPDRKTRADALGVWAAVSGLALALGPVIGGLPGGLLELAGDLLVQPGLRGGRVRDGGRRGARDLGPSGPPDRRGGVLLRRRILGLHVVCGDPGGAVGLHLSVDRGAFVLCGVSGVAFVITEHRVKSPMLDLSMFRRPPFAGSNFVAFVAYFGTFSIFFFTALYLQVVADASAYQTAVDFFPMAAGLIIASALTGPLVARIGPRWPMTIGCLLAGGGILVANAVLSPTVDSRPGLGAAARRHRHRHAARARDIRPLDGGATGALGHGGLGDQHEPGNGRGVRRGHPRVHRQRQAHRRPGRPTQGDRDTAQLPEPGRARDSDGRCIERWCGDSSAEHSKNAAVAQIATKVVNAAYNAFGRGCTRRCSFGLPDPGGAVVAA